ncbi:thiamine diphosphokinase [Oceanobacillus bengalensis]|uniref:Thiamine diphosphokinase n=1 Tax=Oceanobacillus bengalensis TaxID=1435466 RepID=A0A494Z1J8_9BACI|nr:thiamine diphosphokinase [Oceanobacillus bengalensis]RKQ16263.1 thiamine diphosphokinase [Oceanobacillus bengalensis]
MISVAIVANGPIESIPDLRIYQKDIDCWIGADRGAFVLAEQGISMEYAIGDFDSIDEQEKESLKEHTNSYREFPAEKNETDLELAVRQALELEPTKIYFFGVTGGRLDHEIANIQLLYQIRKKGVQGIIIDKQNYIELTFPGTYHLTQDESYENISFIPFSSEVEGITLTNFYYPLENKTISWGSTRCISNKLLSNNGTFSFSKGILLFVKSRNVILP